MAITRKTQQAVKMITLDIKKVWVTWPPTKEFRSVNL